MTAAPKNQVKNSEKKPAKLTWQRILVGLLILALVAASSFLAYKYVHARNEVQRLSNPQESAREETRQLIIKVGRLVDIPTNETPTIATISDVSKLKDQAFYTKAQNGDKVLIFSQAGRAILYRPSVDKIIELAPINIGTTGSGSQQKAAQ